jgi:hypothetical protein
MRYNKLKEPECYLKGGTVHSNMHGACQYLETHFKAKKPLPDKVTMTFKEEQDRKREFNKALWNRLIYSLNHPE